MVRSLHRRKDMEASIAKGVDTSRHPDLAEAPAPGRTARAWGLLGLALMIPVGILLYLLI